MMFVPEVTISAVLILLAVITCSALFVRIFHNLYLHPLSKFPGPWYAASFSLSGAVISVLQIEPQWLQGLVNKYGSKQYPKSHI